jgi:putative ABC transport system permease protein
MVRVASLAVSPRRRRGWLREWVGELKGRWEEREGRGWLGRMGMYLDLTSRAWGSFPDALSLGGGGWMMEGLLLDLRVAVRSLLKRPGFTLVVVATLAVGIGANGAIFGLARDVLMRPFPYPDPDQVVVVEGYSEENPGLGGNVSCPNAWDLGEGATTMVGISVLNWWQPVLPTDDGGMVLSGAVVTANFFQVLGVQPGLGRFFSPAEDGPGGKRSVVLSHGFWVEQFGADPGVVGEALTLDGTPFEVIGVTSADFEDPWLLGEPGDEPRLWRALGSPPSRWPRSGRSWKALGRIKEGRSHEVAQGELEGIMRGLREAYPEDNTGRQVRLVPLRDRVAGPARGALLTLLGSVGVLLLVASLNLANLLLGRALDRQREFAVQRALGASRWRILRHGSLEALVLALAGGGVGTGLCVLLGKGLAGVGATFLPRPVSGELDGSAALFMVFITAGATLLFGLVPAIRAARADEGAPGREEGRGHTRGRAGVRMQRLLVMGEVSLTVVLLVAAGLLLRSFQELGGVDLGFDTAGVVSFDLHYSGWRGLDAEEAMVQWREVVSAVRALPGIQEAGAMDFIPLGPSFSCDRVSRADEPPPSPGEELCAETRSVLPGALETLGVHLVQGRMINDSDEAETLPVVVVDESMARTHWPGQDPLGKTLRVHDRVHEVVGIVRGIQHFGAGRAQRPTVYLPTPQEGWTGPRRGLALVVRGEGSGSEMVGPVREAVLEVNSSIPIRDITTLSSLQDQSLAAPRFRAFLLGAFGTAALILVILGVGGVMSHSVVRRVREIGVRMAVGADPSEVQRLILREGVALTVLGLGMGMVGAAVAGRFLEALLFQVRAWDPWVYGCAALLILGLGFLSSYLPARRACRVDPVEALSFE